MLHTYKNTMQMVHTNSEEHFKSHVSVQNNYFNWMMIFTYINWNDQKEIELFVEKKKQKNKTVSR